MSEKPMKVEPGQRYAFGVVTAVFDDFSCGVGHAGRPGPHVHYSGDAWDWLVDVGTDCNRYLGSGTSSPVPAPRRPGMMVTKTDCALCDPICDAPATTVRDADGYMFCAAHRHHGTWGAPPPAEPPPPTCEECRVIGKFYAGTKCIKHREAPECAYDRRRFAGEMQQNGVAMSALEAIRARPKPEPWVESCDPLHWIPDA